MTNCPFCSDILLRHVRSGATYWLCRRCRTELVETNGKIAHPGQIGLQSYSVESIRVPYCQPPVKSEEFFKPSPETVGGKVV